jgi:hypothetical protein
VVESLIGVELDAAIPNVVTVASATNSSAMLAVTVRYLRRVARSDGCSMPLSHPLLPSVVALELIRGFSLTAR